MQTKGYAVEPDEEAIWFDLHTQKQKQRIINNNIYKQTGAACFWFPFPGFNVICDKTTREEEKKVSTTWYKSMKMFRGAGRPFPPSLRTPGGGSAVILLTAGPRFGSPPAWLMALRVPWSERR